MATQGDIIQFLKENKKLKYTKREILAGLKKRKISVGRLDTQLRSMREWEMVNYKKELLNPGIRYIYWHKGG